MDNRITEPCYEALANAIVEQAATDYYNARFFLETVERRRFSTERSKKSRINNAKRTIVKVEKFFKSDWFGTICPNLDGEKAFKALDVTYEEERREELMGKLNSIQKV